MSTDLKTINTKDELDAFICCNWNKVNDYLDEQMSSRPIPFYSSVDIRESKNKYAPVDHNMYPAGFNNMCALDLDASTTVIKNTLDKISKDIKVVGIIPESHTKNLFYLDHLAILGKTIRDAGYEVVFLTPDNSLFTEGSESLQLVSHSGFDLTIEKAVIKDGLIGSAHAFPEVIVLNNDQSNPLEVDWKSIKTPIVPTPQIGWFKRQKNTHFEYYKKVADEFCKHFNINPDLVQARYKTVDDVDFEAKEGLDKLAGAVDELIGELEPGANVFVKASQGTYGMGISVVSSGEEIITMNRKERNKMDIGKNKIKFTSLLVQEGVETILKYDNMPAEVTIYLVGGKSVGGFMRANSEKSSRSNLNSRGMVFRKFCISEIREDHDHKSKEALYSIIGRLATLASSYEIEDVL
jgi:glutamate--cysteine ligase